VLITASHAHSLAAEPIASAPVVAPDPQQGRAACA
jgi:hypothetical protein